MGITPSPLGSIASAMNAGLGPKAVSGNFAGTLGEAIQQVNGLQTTAEQRVSELIAGTGQDLHAATLSMEKASLAFDLMLQVRNKMVSAYQEISRLQF